VRTHRVGRRRDGVWGGELREVGWLVLLKCVWGSGCLAVQQADPKDHSRQP